MFLDTVSHENMDGIAEKSLEQDGVFAEEVATTDNPNSTVILELMNGTAQGHIIGFDNLAILFVQEGNLDSIIIYE